MLKQQSIPVGQIDTIAIAIDKQKVSEKGFAARVEFTRQSKAALWQIFPAHNFPTIFLSFPPFTRDTNRFPFSNATVSTENVLIERLWISIMGLS